MSFKPKIPKKQKLRTPLKMVLRLLKKQKTVWRSQMGMRTVKCPPCPWD